MASGNRNNKPDVSLPRRILIFILIIAFWAFYYWYSGNK